MKITRSRGFRGSTSSAVVLTTAEIVSFAVQCATTLGATHFDVAVSA